MALAPSLKTARRLMKKLWVLVFNLCVLVTEVSRPPELLTVGRCWGPSVMSQFVVITTDMKQPSCVLHVVTGSEDPGMLSPSPLTFSILTIPTQ